MALREALIAAAAALLLLPASPAAQAGGLAAGGLAVAPAGAGLVDRFAVVVGNDRGHASDQPLRWAEADAARVAGVLQEVGGVRPENLVLLRGQDAGAARRALIAVNDRIRGGGRQAVLFVYYSGHADAGALHLGESALELPELEQLVRGSAAAFRLLILDACRSGALTRVKGGQPIPPFPLGGGDRLPGEGAVFLTSSSASEDSQESDELKGSFFTHALVSGLLGAADGDGDGQVTLEEAYRHAYDATLRASSRSLAGLQHPTFQYDVRGQGDVVLTTLAGRDRTRAWLTLPDGPAWLVFQGSEDGPVVGEVTRGDRARRLSVREGRYFVRGRGDDVLLEGTVAAPAGAAVQVDPARLTRTAYARLVRKGAAELRSATSVELEWRIRSPLASEGRPCPGLAAGTAVALRPLTLHARLGWCQSGFTAEGLRARAEGFDLEVGATHAWDLPWASLEVGLSLGAAILHQSFQTAGVAPPRTSAGLLLAPVASVSRDVGRRTYLFVAGSAATYLYRVEDAGGGAASLGPSFALRFSAGMGFRL
jgi:hypothetical protein